MMRKYIGIVLFLPLALFGQKPYINSISPTHVEFGQTVTISGSNLSNVSKVYFGGVEVGESGGTLNVISDNLVEVTVPAGATQGVITVLDETNDVLAQSSQQFFISFVGSAITDYSGESLIDTEEQAASNICMCDLDSDGKNDIVVLHNVGLSDPDNTRNEFTVYYNNTTTSATLDIAQDSKENNSINESGFISVACEDLDNDGRKDLAFTSNLGTNSRDIYIYRNESTAGNINLTPLNISSLTLPNTSGGDQRIPRTIKVADMDGDGLNDLVVGNDTEVTFHIYRNTTSGSSISFASPFELPIQTGTTDEAAGLIELADFNNDGLLDVVTSTFRVSNTSILFFQNRSIEGNFAFQNDGSVTNGGQNTDIISGDFNDDGLNDIVVTSNLTGLITTFTNQTTGASISFGNQNNLVTTGSSATGVSLADMNGDGLLDIVSTNAGSNIHIFENTSSGSISFGTEEIENTSSTTQYLVTGDLNGDAKPDIAYTHNVGLDQVGNLGIILNRNCVEPELSPGASESTFCDSPETFTLTATASPGATYDWSVVSGNRVGGVNDFSTGTVNSASFELTGGSTSGTIQVTITSEDGACTTEFDQEVYTISNSVTTTPSIDISQAGILCVGDNVTLSSSSTNDFYFWTLPDGSSQTGSSITLNPVAPEDAGTYLLRVQNSGDCFSDDTSIEVQVSQPPKFQVFNNGDDTFCETLSAQLEIPNFPSDYSYQWKRDGANISGATNATYTATLTGNYSVMITDLTDNCTNETDVYSVSAVTEPVSIINGVSEICEDVETTFSAGSTGQSGFTLEYAWEVDGSPVTPASPTELVTSFASTGAHTVTLTTSYNSDEVASCSDQTTFNVTVSATPTIGFDQTDLTAKCQAEIVTVGLSNPSATTIDTYSWVIRNADPANDTIISTGSGTTLDVSTPVGVDTVYAVVDILTTIGCTVTDSIRIRNFESNVDISSTDFASILEFDTALLEEATNINLTAENVSSDASWEPADQFSDPTGTNVTFFPQNPISTVTLTGTDVDGCLVSTEVTITLDNIRPKRTFSPNGDGMNDCWEILNIGDIGEDDNCKVYVFDSRGRNILVQDTFDNENCVWDGNFGSTPVPEGIYYFVLNCNTETFSKTGSILLAR